MARVTTGLMLLCILTSAGPTTARQAGSQPPAARLGGILTAAGDDQPVRKATLTLTGITHGFSRTTSTDGEGRWHFDGLPGGEYALRAERPGYLEMVYGARLPGRMRQGTPIVLAAGQHIDDLPFSLPRAGVIAGIITDEYGDPAYSVPVRAYRYAYRNGERIVTTGGAATTDDLGAYRLAGLMPGDYLVVAVPRDTVAMETIRARSSANLRAQFAARAAAGDQNARAGMALMTQAQREGRMPEPVNPVGYVPMYYPSAVRLDTAAPVAVGLSSQVFGIDIRLALVETVTVEGVVLNAQGEGTQSNVRLADPAMPVSQVGEWMTSSSSDGRFAFGGLVPGVYAVWGNNGSPNTIGGPAADGGAYQTSDVLSVRVPEGGLSDIEIPLRAGVDISGRLDLTTIRGPVAWDQVRVNFFPISRAVDPEMALFRTVPDADGTFRLSNVTPARYRVDVAGLPAGWHVQSAIWDDADAADHLLVVEPGCACDGGVLTFTDRVSGVGGVITDLQGRPAARYSVVLFPADPALRLPQSRRIEVAQTGADGRYLIRNLPAGEYRLAVVEDLEPEQQFDAAFLESLLQASVALDLSEGQTAARDLRVAR